jgi:hypothetical protein
VDDDLAEVLARERREQEWPCETCSRPRRVHAVGLPAPDLCLGADADARERVVADIPIGCSVPLLAMLAAAAAGSPIVLLR